MKSRKSLDGDGGHPDGRTLADGLFLGSPTGNRKYLDAMQWTTDAVADAVGDTDRPYSGRQYEALRSSLDCDTIPDSGSPLLEVLEEVTEGVLENSVYPNDEACVAHLQCPPMIPGLVAEAMLTAINQSMDSFDQAPAATVVEERLIDDLTDLFDLGKDADGVVTTGGTQSNYQGLLLARDRYVADRLDRSVRECGLPPEAADMRVLCSDQAHFTAAQAAAELGLGEDAVVTVPSDDEYRMDTRSLRSTIQRLESDGKRPFALFCTAGTTDFGSIDPLAELADIAAEHDLWYHVDAAYGGAVAVSDDHRESIAGIEQADSLAVDFHKLFFQPISCGAFLLGDGGDFDLMSRNAAYLNPEDDDVPHRVEKSVLTTRRFDALKPYVAFRTLGRKGMAALVHRTLETADRAAEMVRAAPAYELACDPTLNVVTFRYKPERQHPDLSAEEWSDRVNAEIRESMFDAGEAVVARTAVDGRTHLKLTLLNPRTTEADIQKLLKEGKQLAAAVEAGESERADSSTDSTRVDDAAVREVDQ